MIDLLSKYQPHTLKLVAGMFSYLMINSVMLDQELSEGTKPGIEQEILDSMRSKTDLFFTGNILFLHYFYSVDVLSAEFMCQYLEFFLANLFEQNEDSDAELNLAKIPSKEQVKLYLYLVLKPVRKKDAAQYTDLVNVFQKYLPHDSILEIKVKEVRESYSQGIQVFENKIEKL
jgi:hypothetical protein